MSKRFDKEVFIESVKSNLKTLYRQTLVDATKQQVFQAVSYAVKDTIIDNWMETQKVYEEEDPKMVYYMSMEFLMGRALWSFRNRFLSVARRLWLFRIKKPLKS